MMLFLLLKIHTLIFMDLWDTTTDFRTIVFSFIEFIESPFLLAVNKVFQSPFLQAVNTFCPCSFPLAYYSRDFITSVVLGNDMVPRYE